MKQNTIIKLHIISFVLVTIGSIYPYPAIGAQNLTVIKEKINAVNSAFKHCEGRQVDGLAPQLNKLMTAIQNNEKKVINKSITKLVDKEIPFFLSEQADVKCTKVNVKTLVKSLKIALEDYQQQPTQSKEDSIAADKKKKDEDEKKKIADAAILEEKKKLDATKSAEIAAEEERKRLETANRTVEGTSTTSLPASPQVTVKSPTVTTKSPVTAPTTSRTYTPMYDNKDKPEYFIDANNNLTSLEAIYDNAKTIGLLDSNKAKGVQITKNYTEAKENLTKSKSFIEQANNIEISGNNKQKQAKRDRKDELISEAKSYANKAKECVDKAKKEIELLNSQYPHRIVQSSTTVVEESNTFLPWIIGLLSALAAIGIFWIVKQKMASKHIDSVNTANNLGNNPTNSSTIPPVTNQTIQTLTAPLITPQQPTIAPIIQNTYEIKNISGKYFSAEVLTASGPRKDYDGELGEDVAGFWMTDKIVFFWVLDGISQQTRLINSGGTDYFSSRMMAQFLAGRLRSKSYRLSKITVDAMKDVIKDSISDLATEINDKIKGLNQTDYSALINALQTSNSLSAGTAIQYGFLGINGSTLCCNLGDNKLLLLPKGEKLDPKMQATDKSMTLKLSIVLDNNKPVVVSPRIETTDFKVLEMQSVDTVIACSDGVSSQFLDLQSKIPSFNYEDERVGKFYESYLQRTSDDKTLCIIQIKNT
jgi:hypothetical protein